MLIYYYTACTYTYIHMYDERVVFIMGLMVISALDTKTMKTPFSYIHMYYICFTVKGL